MSIVKVMKITLLGFLYSNVELIMKNIVRKMPVKRKNNALMKHLIAAVGLFGLRNKPTIVKLCIEDMCSELSILKECILKM